MSGDNKRILEIVGAIDELRWLIHVNNFGPFSIAALAFTVMVAAGVATYATKVREREARDQELHRLLADEVLPPREIGPLVGIAAVRTLKNLMPKESVERLQHDWLEHIINHHKKRWYKKYGNSSNSFIRGESTIECPTPNGMKARTLKSAPNVFVPATLWHFSESAADKEARRMKSWESYLEAIKDSFVRGDIVDGESEPEDLRDRKNKLKFTIVQSYYVSSSGVIINLEVSNRTPCQLYAPDENYSLSERPYMIQMRNEDESVFEKPYLSASGHGILSTTCVPDYDDSVNSCSKNRSVQKDISGIKPNANASIPGAISDCGSAFRGAICIDYRPTRLTDPGLTSQESTDSQLTASIYQSALFTAKIRDDSGLDNGHSHLGNSTGKVDCDKGGDSENRVCRIPLVVDRKMHRWLDLSIRFPNNRPLYFFLLLAPLTLCGIAVVLARTWRWRRLEAQLSMLRDLPIGVVYDERTCDGRILAANDRAEELVGTELPSFRGLGETRERSPEFWSVFEKKGIVNPNNDPEYIDTEKREPFEVDNLSEMLVEQRTSGKSSTYYVQVSGKKLQPEAESWLRVVGTPVFRRNKGGKPVSFAVLEKLQGSELNAISNTLKARKKGDR